MPFLAVRALPRFDPSFELHGKRIFRTRDFPRIAQLEPFIRLLDLISIHNALRKNPEVVTQAIADRRQVQRGHRIQKARRQPPQAAIAQSGVHFVIGELLPIQIQFTQRLAADFFHLQIHHVVAEQAANQKFEREVIDPLYLNAMMSLLRRQPALHQMVAHRK